MWTTLYKNKLHSGSITVISSSIGFWISSATSVNCDILSFKTTHLISTMNKFSIRSSSRNSLDSNSSTISMFREAFRYFCPESTILNPNFQSHSIKMDFFLQIIMRQQLVQWIGYMLEYLGFKSWQQQENYHIFRTSRSAPALTHLPTPAISVAVKWPGHTVWPITCLEPSLKISGAIPWHNLPSSME